MAFSKFLLNLRYNPCGYFQGSNNRLKAKLELAKFHIKLANQKKDYFFKLANVLAKKYDNIFIENLKAMAKIWGKDK